MSDRVTAEFTGKVAIMPTEEPGGMFLGYDLVASPVASVVHLVDRSPHRLIERGTLEPVLAQAGLQIVNVQYSLHGLVLRFAARKTCPP